MSPSDKISNHFSLKEATYLPSWKICHIPSEQELANLKDLFSRLDKIRDILGRPILVTVAIRPSKVNCPGSPYHGKDYNAFIKGAKGSAHIEGKAVDWVCMTRSCDGIRDILKPKLKELGLRMEDLPGSGWIHVDTRTPSSEGARFFKP